jgi:hypothetical protein
MRRFHDPEIGALAALADELEAVMVGVYTITKACSWTGMYNGAEVTVSFSVGTLTPNAEQQYVLDNFIVPQGSATNPQGQTGPGASPGTPPGNLPEGEVLETDGSGGAQFETAPGLGASGVTAGTYGDSGHVGQFTVNSDGVVTAAESVAIAGGGGGVASFNTRTGAVTLEKSDVTGTGLTYSDVGADASGAAAAAQSAAEAASVPTSDLPISIANGGTGASSASAARTALGLGTAATQASSAFDASGAAATAQSAAESFATSAVAAAAKASLVSTAFTSNAYTLQASDAQTAQQASNGSTPATITVPPSVFTAGEWIEVTQTGSGKIAFAEGAGVTINWAGSFSSGSTGCRAEYSVVRLLCTASDTFLLSGDAA